MQITLDGTVLFSYHYNTHDRLVQVDDLNGAAIGRYYDDPFGRRLWKQAEDETILFFSSDEGQGHSSPEASAPGKGMVSSLLVS